MPKLTVFRLFLFFSLFVLIAGLRGDVATAQQQTSSGSLLATAKRISGDDFKFETNSPKGAKVFGAKKPSAKMLAAIDQGLTDLFAVARKNDYSKRLKYSDYTIFIANADRLKDYRGVYSPDIAVGAAQYAGTIYDQGGYVYAAGMVTSNTPCAFLIAEHTKDFNRAADVVRYEGEHLVLYHNDRQRYMDTRDHSKGGSHPILQ